MSFKCGGCLPLQPGSQLSYTPTGKVYHIRKRHECQERFCISAKKSARRFGRRAEGFFRIVCAPARSRLAVAADDVRDGGGQLLVPVGVEMLAVERAHLRDRAGVQKPQAIRLGDHLILRRHALRDGERLRVILRVALRRGRAERRRGHEQDLRPRGQHTDDEPHELVHAGADVLGGAGFIDLAVVRAEHEDDILHRAVALDAQRQRLERGAPGTVLIRKRRRAADQAVLRNVIPVAEQGLQHAGVANVAPVAVLPVGREAIGVAVTEAEDLDHAAHLTSGNR